MLRVVGESPRVGQRCHVKLGRRDGGSGVVLNSLLTHFMRCSLVYAASLIFQISGE